MSGQRARSNGQSLVEFALLASLLIALLMGMVNFVLAFNAHIVLRNAVSEGSYYISQNPGDTVNAEVLMRDEMALLGDVSSTNPQITFTSGPCSANGANSMRETMIRVEYTYSFLFASAVPQATINLVNQAKVPQFGGCQ